MIFYCALIFVYDDKLIPKHGTRYRIRIKMLLLTENNTYSYKV